MLNETMYRIALQYLPHYGSVLVRKLIRETGTAAEAFSNSSRAMHSLKKYNRFLERPVMTPAIRNRVEREMQWMETNGVKLSFFTDDDFPQRLNNCHDAPFLFYYRGDGRFNPSKTVAIVGTRHASSYGKEAIAKIIGELADTDISIISGLARGIDTIAHEEALNARLHTIAVLGSGLGVVYPESNLDLSRNIIRGNGSILSEYPYYTKPERQNFPRRNRIIAGMADAVVIAETRKRGGSMITAFIAHSYNRDIFAVPGSIFQDSFFGCHELIRSNMAAIITSGAELMEMMNWDYKRPKNIQRKLFVELTAREKYVVDNMEAGKRIPIDHISASCSELTPSQIASVLLELEMKGILVSHPGKTYRLLD